MTILKKNILEYIKRKPGLLPDVLLFLKAQNNKHIFDLPNTYEPEKGLDLIDV